MSYLSAARAVLLLGLLLFGICVLSVNGDSVSVLGGRHPHPPGDGHGSDCSSDSGDSSSQPSTGGSEVSSSGSDCSSSDGSTPSTGGGEVSSTGGTIESSSSGSDDCSSSDGSTPSTGGSEVSSSSSSGSDDSSSDCPSSDSSSQPSTGGSEVSSSSSGSDDCSSSDGSTPSTGGSEQSSSSTGGSDDCSSSDDSSSQPSTGGSEQSSSSGSDDCSSSDDGSTPSTGGSEQSSSSSGSSSGNEDCQRGTYSHNGFAPCTPCPKNTYANIRETSCTACPVHTSCPSGAASLTECVCDDGYTSLWATGGPCYPSSDAGSYEWCGVGTYSETGYGPNCTSCGANSYANIGETECHECPANSHAPAGAASLTECMCDDGYTSKWASGGPCYKEGDDEPSTGESNSTSLCSSYTSGDECNRDTSCQSFYGHTCDNDRWSFIACQDKATQGVCAPGIISNSTTSNSTTSPTSTSSSGNSTCATNGDGDRAWFATGCLPNGWSKAAVNSKCGSCCKPKHYPGGSGNIGGCTFANNSACITLEYAGTCPSVDAINIWRIKVIGAIAETVSSVMNISKSDATIGITINVMPRTNQGTTSCEVRVQIFAPKTGSLTANDFIEAIWEQYNEHGNDLLAQSSSLTGVAAYHTFGSLTPLDDIPSDDNTNGAITATLSSSSSAVVGIIAIAASIIISV